MPICICAHNMYSGQKRALDLLELELQKVVSFSMCLSVSCWNHTVLMTITHSTLIDFSFEFSLLVDTTATDLCILILHSATYQILVWGSDNFL